MALAILDGNQTATNLSTILTGGAHITAHTVVSLGTQAITDMRGAVSGSVVSIPSLPAISGTVTANLAGSFNGTIETVSDVGNVSHAVAIHMYDDNGTFIGRSNNPLIVSGTVTVGSGTVTIGAGTAQIGSVTASISNFPATQVISGTVTANLNTPNFVSSSGYGATAVAIIGYYDNDIDEFIGINTINRQLPIRGTVTVGNTVTIAGTVTASPTGTQTIAGTVTANVNGVPYDNGIPYFGVGYFESPGSSFIQVSQDPNCGLPINGTVTASLAISSTAITSGSFASLTSATLVPGNVARKMATVFNQGAGQLFVNAGATATTLGGGFMVALSSGDYFECGFTTTTLSAIFATAGTASWVSH